MPLDPAYPLERLAYMLRDCEPLVLLTHQKVKESVSTPLRNMASQRAIRVVDLEADREQWAKRSQENLSRHATGLTPGNLVYVIYTSGSTGRPKSVEVEHQNAVNFILWAMHEFGPEQLSHTLFATSLNFDPSIYECFVPLAMGASTIVVPDVLSCPSQGQAVSLLNTVPSAMLALLDSTGIPQSTRTVTLGGEVLRRSLVERIFKESDVERVGNAYGPTETGYTTYAATKKGEALAEHIGRPLWNTQVYILDTNGQPAPIGVTGEIFVGGHGVSRGYGKRPGLTAERFLPDSFSSIPGSRMYKTGDLGRYLADGNIECLGRNDFQVKHRGFRIELGEIEAKLVEHPAVQQAAVLMREDRPGEKRLVAYVVAAPGAKDGFVEKGWPTELLRVHLANFLTNHMVPEVYVELARLPVTENGKLNRSALPEPEGAACSRRDYEPPIGETEKRLAGIWAELLGVERVGRRDNFFELGGHSLLAMVVVARLRRGLGVDIAMHDVLERPVLSDLALEVRRTAESHQPEATL